MNAQQKVSRSYRQMARRYDALLNMKSWWSRMIMRLIWGRDNFDPARGYGAGLCSYLPDDFSGRLLDVPTGTALFTADKYARMKQADIYAVDYTEDMLRQAQQKFDALGLRHVHCRQGDAARLPFASASFDAVLSMNGFHVFPEKQAAWCELYRVLRPGGLFLGSFYLQGERPRTDWFVRHFYVAGGYFTPPFLCREQLFRRLARGYQLEAEWSTGAVACFVCRKLADRPDAYRAEDDWQAE